MASFRKRALAARPSLRWALGGTLFWAACAGANATGMLWLRGWSIPATAGIGLLFAAGAALAFVPGLWLGMLIGGQRRERTFAAVFLSLACSTVAATALLNAWEYRSYYAQWHPPPLTPPWFFSMLFTGLLATYHFAVLGLRLLFPFPFAALFAVAVWSARRAR